MSTIPLGSERRARTAMATLIAAVGYNAVVTQDTKFGGVPLKLVLLAPCLVAWAVERRPWSVRSELPALTVPVLVLAMAVPVVWFAVAFTRHHGGDPAQKPGLAYAATEASRFLYLLLFFPLVDHFRRYPRTGHRVWLWPTLFTCAFSFVVAMVFALTRFSYGDHQFTLFSGVIGPAPSGYRVALVTQVMVIPAMALVLGGVATDRLTRGHAWIIAAILVAGAASQTRGYWLGLLVVAGVLIVLTQRWPVHRNVRLALLTLLLVAVAAGQVVTDRLHSSSTNQLSLSERLQEAPQLLHGARQHLLLGSGLGATLPDGYTRSSTSPWSFELTYYQLLFELGILGLLVVLAVPLLAVWRCWTLIARAGPGATSARIALATLLALLVTDSTNPYLISSVGMLALAIPLAVAELAIAPDRVAVEA